MQTTLFEKFCRGGDQRNGDGLQGDVGSQWVFFGWVTERACLREGEGQRPGVVSEHPRAGFGQALPLVRV